MKIFCMLYFRQCRCWNIPVSRKDMERLVVTVSWDMYQFSSVTQSCPTLCDPMNCSTPGLPVQHQLLEFTQTHVHRVGDAIQPSHPMSSPFPPAPNPSQHQSLFQWVNSSHEIMYLCHQILWCRIVKGGGIIKRTHQDDGIIQWAIKSKNLTSRRDPLVNWFSGGCRRKLW